MVYLFLKVYHSLPVAKMVDGSVHEIVALNDVFNRLKQQAKVPVPNWDRLVINKDAE
ncbi:hypothetical protein D3C86_2230340 [compost metagenome]